jgi:hypothetical protein
VDLVDSHRLGAIESGGLRHGVPSVGIGWLATEATAATGQLAVSEKDCRDIVFATMDGALGHRLVPERGWSDERFAELLATLWMSQLVKPAVSQGNDLPSPRTHRTHAHKGSSSDTATEKYEGPIRHERAERRPRLLRP